MQTSFFLVILSQMKYLLHKWMQNELMIPLKHDPKFEQLFSVVFCGFNANWIQKCSFQRNICFFEWDYALKAQSSFPMLNHILYNRMKILFATSHIYRRNVDVTWTKCLMNIFTSIRIRRLKLISFETNMRIENIVVQLMVFANIFKQNRFSLLLPWFPWY